MSAAAVGGASPADDVRSPTRGAGIASTAQVVLGLVAYGATLDPHRGNLHKALMYFGRQAHLVAPHLPDGARLVWVSIWLVPLSMAATGVAITALPIGIHLAHRWRTAAGEVRDDGTGGADPGPTGGLQGLADRVAALGAGMEVVSPIGGGTTVTAVRTCG